MAQPQQKLGQSFNRRLGDLLVADGLLTPAQLQKALGEQKGSTEKLGSVLIKLGFINEEQLIGFLSRQYGVPSITLAQLEIDPGVLRLVPAPIAKKYEVIPVRKMGSSLAVAMADPTNVFALDDIAFMTNLQVLPLVASQSAIRKAIDRHYESKTEALASVMQDMSTDLANVEVVEGDEEEKSAQVDVFELKESGGEAPVVKLVNMVLVDAIQKGASDVHFESYEKVFRIRFRMDGVLHEMLAPPKRLESAILSRIKIMSNLDIAERRLPQDGRIKLKYNNREIDFRVSTLPTIFGEKAVLRILDKDALQLDLTKLGFDSWSPAALRSFLRQDPDVILVGETRDVETAQISIRAALTGHLVFTTLHTNDCPSTIARLLEMGIPPFLISSSLLLILAQRLARRLCAACKEPYEVDEETLAPYGHVPTGRGKVTLHKGKGCPTCSFTGMKGRVAIYEVMPISEELKDAILRTATIAAIREIAQSQGMKTLRQAALLKVLAGTTSIEEVLRVTLA